MSDLPFSFFLFPFSFLLESAADGVHHPLLIGELARIELGVDQVSVDGYLEAPAARRDQFQVVDLLFVCAQQLIRQTDGLGLVVSHRTVFDFQVHA